MSQRSSHLEVIKYLCNELQFDPNNRDGRGYNAVQTAVLAGNLDIVKYLVEEQRVDTTVVDQKTGSTLLHLAVVSGNLDVVKYISEHTQVDRNAKDNRGRTAMDLAYELGRPIRQTNNQN